MPKTKPISLSGMVDIDMEEDSLIADAFPTPDSNQENTGAAKKKGAKSKANAKKFTKPKRTSSGPVAPRTITAPRAKAARKRAPLKEQINKGHAEETEEVDEFAAETEREAAIAEAVEPKPAAKRKAPEKRTGRPAKAQAVKHINAVEKDGEFEYTPTAVRQRRIAAEKSADNGKTSKHHASAEPQRETVIQETQVPMEVDASAAEVDVDQDDEILPQSVFRRSNNARITPRRRQPPLAKRRAGSASSPERAIDDPALRRKLGDMTRRFENVDLKYKNLREVAMKEADTNYDKLKTESDARAKGGILSWINDENN